MIRITNKKKNVTYLSTSTLNANEKTPKLSLPCCKVAPTLILSSLCAPINRSTFDIGRSLCPIDDGWALCCYSPEYDDVVTIHADIFHWEFGGGELLRVLECIGDNRLEGNLNHIKILIQIFQLHFFFFFFFFFYLAFQGVCADIVGDLCVDVFSCLEWL
jgi:hypothetical protein